MKKMDLLAEFPGLVIIHQKIPGHEVGRHQHEEHEFFLPLRGEITVHYGTETVKAGPGHMLYVPPDLDHSFSSSAQGAGERVIWLIDKKTWKKHGLGKISPTAFAANSLVKELLFYLLIHQKAKGTPHFVSALVESLGESLRTAKVFSEHISGKVGDARVQKSLALIDTSLSSLTLAEVARESGLSLRNFNRLFLGETGLTPRDYVILRRVERAKSLLKESRLTVTDIALEVGYQSLSKFIATFKRVTGRLPSDFRASV